MNKQGINKIQYIQSEDGDWVVLKINGEIYSEGHDIPAFEWLNLLSDLANAQVSYLTISDEDMEQGKY